jgi:septal ring factor EnvC (AmiA/AmiB activator)
MEGYAQNSQSRKPKQTTTKTGTQKSKPAAKPVQKTKPVQKSAPAQKKPAQKTTAPKETTTKKEIDDLKNKQDKVKNQMKKIDESLSQTKLTTKQTLQEIVRLNNDIQKRNDLIAKQNRGIAKLELKISTLEGEIGKMEIEYNLMKQKYVDLVYHAYLKNNSYSRLLFVMSAASFQESYRRFNYLQQFASLRKQQAEEIETSRIDLTIKKEQLNETKRLSEELLEQRKHEQTQLLVEKEKQDGLVISLQKKEKELKAELENQQKIANQLNKKIEELIAKEAREAEKRRQAQAATKGGYAMTKEEKVLSGGFEKNKGVLMWPVNGLITGRFGVQPHPVLKNITTNNKGIYITAPKGSEATVVFDGIVTQCFSIPGSNNAVIVRHGNYLTVYANLTNIYVKVGDKVARGNKIGKIYEDAENGNNAVLLFQVWKEKDLLNPELWIKK